MKFLWVLVVSSILACLLSVFIDRNSLEKIWIGLLLIGIALSGTAVSGDRMRANFATGSQSFDRNYFLYPLISCVPFFIVANFL